MKSEGVPPSPPLISMIKKTHFNLSESQQSIFVDHSISRFIPRDSQSSMNIKTHVDKVNMF